MKPTSLRIFLSLGAFTAVLSGCFSTSNTTLTEEKPGKAIVEATIEYPGAPASWGGMEDFLVTVDLRSTGELKLTVADTMIAPTSGESTRMPASERRIYTSEHLLDKAMMIGQISPDEATPSAANLAQSVALEEKPEMTAQEARQKLSQLAQAAETQSPDFQGCLYPVRIKLIRADGSLIEKAGCRSSTGWPGFASQLANEFLRIHFKS